MKNYEKYPVGNVNYKFTLFYEKRVLSILLQFPAGKNTTWRKDISNILVRRETLDKKEI